MMTLGEAAVLEARLKLGQKEATGKNDGSFVEMVQDWIDGEGDWMKGQPWCAAFASWCIYRAALGLKLVPKMPKLASSTQIFKWLSDNRLVLPAPKPGCIGLIRGNEGHPAKTHSHTFLVESVDGDHVRGIDGNWNNQVSETHHKISECDFGEIA
jgi:hypothetical protein